MYKRGEADPPSDKSFDSVRSIPGSYRLENPPLE